MRITGGGRSVPKKEILHNTNMDETDNENDGPNKIETDKKGENGEFGVNEKDIDETGELLISVRQFLIEKRINYANFVNLVIFKSTNDHISFVCKQLLTAPKLGQGDDSRAAIFDENKLIDAINKLLILMDPSYRAKHNKDDLTVLHILKALVRLEYDITTYKIQDTTYKMKTRLDTLEEPLEDLIPISGFNKKDQVSSEALKTSYLNFIKFYVEQILEKHGYDAEKGGHDEELEFWVKKIHFKIFDNDTQDECLNALQSIQSIFAKSDHKIYMLRTFKFILYNFCPKIIGDIDSKNVELTKKLELFDF